MNSDERREALEALAEVWELSPDVRLGQLLAHLGFLGEAHLGRGPGYIEDDELVAVLLRHKVELVARTVGPANPAVLPEGPSDTSVSGSPIHPETSTAAEA